MLTTFAKSLLLLLFAVLLCSVIYPFALWVIGQTFFPFQANGSLLFADGKPVGSLLIAQSFTHDDYFQPRPSAAAYDASASASSALAASNAALRDRVTQTLASIATYQGGKSVAADMAIWLQHDVFNGKSGIVAQWATAHPLRAAAWVNADKLHAVYVEQWMKANPAVVQQFMKDNAITVQPTAADIAVVFFQNFSRLHPGKFPVAVNHVMKPANSGEDMTSIFFAMWREAYPTVALTAVPGDMLTTSGSGLDPHITLQNALFQLDRVATAIATRLKQNKNEVRVAVKKILQENASAPLAGLAGEPIINVLQVNLEMHKRFGSVARQD